MLESGLDQGLGALCWGRLVIPVLVRNQFAREKIGKRFYVSR